MKAVFCEKLGSPDDLVLREVPSPTPGPGEVKVALRARGVSYVDVLMIGGQYQVKRDLPFIPGGEAAGVVLETGSGAYGSPIFKAVQKKQCKALYRALKKSPKSPEFAVGEGSERSHVDRSVVPPE